MQRLLAILLIVVLGAVLLEWDAPIEELAVIHRSSDQKVCAKRSAAWAMARGLVRQHLGAPLSAGFPNRSATSGLDGMSIGDLGDCRYKISAFVDAFYRDLGHTRRYFVAELSYLGRSGWRLDQLDFIENPNLASGQTLDDSHDRNWPRVGQSSVGFSSEKAGPRQFRRTQAGKLLLESAHGTPSRSSE